MELFKISGDKLVSIKAARVDKEKMLQVLLEELTGTMSQLTRGVDSPGVAFSGPSTQSLHF